MAVLSQPQGAETLSLTGTLKALGAVLGSRLHFLGPWTRTATPIGPHNALWVALRCVKG